MINNAIYYGCIILFLGSVDFCYVVNRKIRLSRIESKKVKGVKARCVSNSVSCNRENHKYRSKLVFATELGEIRTVKIRSNLSNIKQNDCLYIVHYSRFDIDIIKDC